MPKAAAIFITGGTLYTLTELIWRGHSHWSMGICGGLCFSLMYLISALPMSRLRGWVLCAALISLVELYAGWLLNLKLGLGIWDYSALPGNILGQICPRYTLFWFLLSIPGTALCRTLRSGFEKLSNFRWTAG